MKKKKLRALLILLISLFLMGSAAFLLTRDTDITSKSLWKEFEFTLQKKETIIDGIKEEAMAYLIISREGKRDYGDLLVVLQQMENGSWERIYENNFNELKPWKIEISDIDGDGIKEILTAVSKTTRFDPTEKNRMFIFNYEDGKLTKKWTGSQIAGVWEDFIVGDLLPIPGNELIFIRKLEGGKECISIYYWFDFGFYLLAESEAYENIESLTVYEENHLQMTYQSKNEEKTISLTVKDGRIVEVAKK